MYYPKILKKLNKVTLFDISKTLHCYFPKVSTGRIYELILQVDSVDLAVDCLFLLKDKPQKLNEVVYSILHYKDNK